MRSWARISPIAAAPAEAGAGPGAAAIGEILAHDRIWPLGNYGGQNLWLADGIRSLGGYHPAKLAQYEQIRKRLYSDRPAGQLAAWLAGRIVVFDRAFEPAQLTALQALGLDLDPAAIQAGPAVLYRNRAALPRARLLTEWQPVSALPDKDALGPFLDGIVAGEVDVRQTVYLAERPDPLPATTTGNLPAPRFLKDGVDEVILAVESPVPALLLLADMMAPGWQVAVDDVSRPLLTADLVLRAVALEAGAHTVRFYYDDPAVRKGLTLTMIGVILIVALLVVPIVLMVVTRARARPRTSGEQDADV